MNKYVWTTGNFRYTRISKHAAIKALNNGKEISLIPCNANPNHIFFSWGKHYNLKHVQFVFDYCENKTTPHLLEKAYNETWYYSPKHLGRYLSYYLVEQI